MRQSPSTGTSIPAQARSSFALAALALLPALLGACATVPRGVTERLVVVSEPSGAWVTVKPDDLHCTTPCWFDLQSMLNYVVVIDMQGYASERVAVQSEAGSITTARSRDLRPNPVRVILRPTGSAPPAPAVVSPPQPSAPAAPVTEVPPEPAASLQNCIQPSAVDREACFGRLRIGMERAAVIALLGTPDGTSRDGGILRYGDRYLKFGGDDTLIGISDRPR